MVLALRNKHICGQLNALILNVFLQVLEILLEIQIYFLDPLLILLLSPLDLNISNLGPLFIELLFQEFTWLHIELNDVIRSELKSWIDILKPRHPIFEVLLLLFLLLLILHPKHLF